MDYQLSVSGTVRKFDRENGNDAIQIDGWLVFSNGARREVDPHGILHDPPEDAFTRLKLSVKYHTALREREFEAFRARRQELYGAVEAGELPELSDIRAELGALRKKVRDRDAILAKLKGEIAKTPQAQKKRQAQEWEAEHAQLKQEALQAIERFKL
jgi:hypothetical protein